jgi:hypothetical protein
MLIRTVLGNWQCKYVVEGTAVENFTVSLTDPRVPEFAASCIGAMLTVAGSLSNVTDLGGCF